MSFVQFMVKNIKHNLVAVCLLLALFRLMMMGSQLISVYQSNVDYDMGEFYVEMKKYEDAIASFDQALEHEEYNLEALNARGFAYMKLGKYKESVADFNQLMQMNPDLIEPYYYRGIVYIELEKYQQAIQDFNYVITTLEENKNTVDNLPDLLKKEKEQKERQESYNIILAEVYAARGMANGHLRYKNQAVKDIDKAMQLDPDNNANLMYARGVVYFLDKKYAEAIADFKKTVEIDPDYTDAYFSLANVYGELEKFDYALFSINKAIQIEPENSILYSHRCSLNIALDHINQAFADCNKAISLDLDNYYAYYFRAYAYIYKGDYRKAIASFDKAIKIKPDFLEAKTDKLQLLGELKRSRYYYRHGY